MIWSTLLLFEGGKCKLYFDHTNNDKNREFYKRLKNGLIESKS